MFEAQTFITIHFIFSAASFSKYSAQHLVPQPYNDDYALRTTRFVARATMFQQRHAPPTSRRPAG